MLRQCALGALGGMLAACGGPRLTLGTEGYIKGFLGGAVADEPHAALVARDILSAGGTAADAAVALYMALSVTLPSRASLAGGGVCLVHDSVKGRVEALDFSARTPSVIPPDADRPSAVPVNLRGMFALHARYGRLRWEQLVAPAENMARFGIALPRAFAKDLALVAGPLFANAEARKTFARPDGRALAESEGLVQFELAAVLGRIRSQGPGGFYLGQFARDFVEGVRAAGGTLTLEDLRAVKPEWREALGVPFGNLVIHFAPPPSAGGVIQSQMWRVLAGGDRYADARPELRGHLVTEAALRSFADLGRWRAVDGSVSAEPLGVEALMSGFDPSRAAPAAALAPKGSALLPNPASTGFAVVDWDGSAVVCTVSANNLFGTGRMVPGTGILLAAAPGIGPFGPPLAGPMLAVNPHVKEFYFAGAPSGGAAAPAAMIQVLAKLWFEKGALDAKALTAVLRAPRLHRAASDVVSYEPGVPAAVLEGLRRRGHRLREVPDLGRVNAIYCAQGAPGSSESCRFAADPRGAGMAVSGES